VNVRNVSDVKQIEVLTAEPLIEAEIATAKMKKYKSPGSDLIPAALIHAGGEMLLSAIHKLNNSVWNKEELHDQWKESIVVPVRKKGDKTDWNNYRGILLLSTSFKMFSNILLLRLSPYIDEIIGDYQCEFRRNKSTTAQIFCIRQILDKNGSTMRQYISTSRKPMIR
jgi:hypothetical protein